jgi:hypothetical protein
MRFSRIYLFIAICFLAFNSSAQNIDSSLNVLVGKYPTEKIYIQYDKEFYVAGETIWLKAYMYSDGKPSSISSNFYLQLVNSEGRPVTTKKYPILGAVAKGNIDLPDSLPQGNYYIRAFTPYTLNFDEAFVYKKNIFIFNPQTSKPVVASSGSRNINIRFFPESGNMIDGMINVVAFKATDEKGMPVDVSGSIKTEDGTNIVSFRSYHDGIGKVQFKAQSEKKYFAEIEINGGQRSFPLPAVQNSGVILKVQDEKAGKMFQLARSEKDKSLFDVLRLVAQIRNRVVYDNEIHFEDYPSVKGHLITDSLPSGILHFTVFDKNGVPLAERLSFVNNREYVTNASVDIVKSGKDKKAENILS